MNLNFGCEISFKECITQGPYGHKNVRGSVQTGTYRHGIVLGESVGKFSRDASPACIRSLLNMKGPKNTIPNALGVSKKGPGLQLPRSLLQKFTYCKWLPYLLIKDIEPT
jgi:hypothetical protein